MASKSWQGNFFEDFSLNQRISCPIPRTITSGDTAAYIALTGDRTPGFCGPEGWVHPLVTFHATFGQTVRHISLNARANLGYAGIRWHRPVRLGDTLSMELEIVGLKENSSGTTGIVWVRNEATNQHGEVVLTFWRWVMIKKRGAEPTPYATEPVIPTMPKSVEPSELRLTPELWAGAAATGGRWAWEDYEQGERLWHMDGMQVNPSDHMAFTRLFQNSARVHFDGLLTEGKPLVYGGVVISHGYSQSFNGLEHRLGLLAINGGSHANPVYAGDTLTTLTEVLDKAEVSDEYGALRLRMVVVKNRAFQSQEEVDSFAIQTEHPTKPGRLRYAQEVVLDLDYWEAVPRAALLKK